MNLISIEMNMNHKLDEFSCDFKHFLLLFTQAWPTDSPTDRATNIQTDRASYIGAKAPLKDEGGNRRNITARYELQRGDNRKFETCLAKEKKVFFSNACLLLEQSLCAWSSISKPLKLKSIVWIVHASSSIQRLGALLKSANAYIRQLLGKIGCISNARFMGQRLSISRGTFENKAGYTANP